MIRQSVIVAALVALSACVSVPNDMPETTEARAQAAFEARRAQLQGTPAAAQPTTPAPTDDIAATAAAAIAEAETGGTPPATPATPAAPAPAGVAAPAGRGLPALPGSSTPPDNSAPGCAQFATAGAAQNWFIANGGPSIDPDNLDPDGDGFVCGWRPTNG